MGTAIPHTIGRHTHHKARPEADEAPRQAPTGIDYLGLVTARHSDELAQRLRYSAFDTRLTDHNHDLADTATSSTEESTR
jgi:hypothetical protein